MPSASRRLRFSSTLPRQRLVPVVAVFAGGLVGSGTREAIAGTFRGDTGAFPVDLLVVNLVGSFLLGWYLSRRERAVAARSWSLPFWAIGVMGSFTTFSAFSYDVLLLIQANRFAAAGTYTIASFLGGLACAQVGQRLGNIA